MSNTNTGGPAFPCEIYDLERDTLIKEEGMTLRDYFAAKAMAIAMQAHVRGCGEITDWNDIGGSLSCVAADAYRLADAMLEERKA